MIGKLRVKGREQCRFWVRVLKIEHEIEHVSALINKPGPRKWAASPVITEYSVDDDFKIYVFIVMDIDQIGIMGGQGWVWLSDKVNEPAVRQERDQLAAETLDLLQKKSWDEVLELELEKQPKGGKIHGIVMKAPQKED